MLELIIERGMQLLQTPAGEKLPRVIETLIRQMAAEPGVCQFTMFVNEPGLCKYDEHKKQVSTPGGYLLRKVEVLKYKPAESVTNPAKVLCQCTISFQYNTTHRPHFVASAVN